MKIKGRILSIFLAMTVLVTPFTGVENYESYAATNTLPAGDASNSGGGGGGGQGSSSEFDFLPSESTVKNGEKDVLLDSIVMFKFSKAVSTPETLSKNAEKIMVYDENDEKVNVHITAVPNNVKIPSQYTDMKAFEQDYRRYLTVNFVDGLKPNKTYTITLRSGIEAKNGSDITMRAYDITFSTVIGEEKPEIPQEPSNPSIPEHGNRSSGGIGGGSNNEDKKEEQNKPSIEVASSGKVKITTKPEVDTNTGIASTKVKTDILTKALSDTKENTDGTKVVQIDVPKVENAKSYEPTLPIKFLAKEAQSEKVELKTDIATVVVPGNMISESQAKNAKEISFNISKVEESEIPETVKATIGDRPVIKLNLKVDGKPSSWKNNNTKVTVEIPYTPTQEELKNTEHITVWYIDEYGNTTPVPSAKYDPSTKSVRFDTTHFSKYAITSVHKTFEDIERYNWANKGIEVLASKGIINGTSEKTYSPSANVTRGDYITLLVKTLGLTADVKDNFTDVKEGTYYYDAIGIAKQLGIATGLGDNKFNPKETISRQDMMVLTERALRKVNKIDSKDTSSSLDNFKDNKEVSSYAVNSINKLIDEGLITGNGNAINPKGNTTRAETASFLYRIYNK